MMSKGQNDSKWPKVGSKWVKTGQRRSKWLKIGPKWLKMAQSRVTLQQKNNTANGNCDQIPRRGTAADGIDLRPLGRQGPNLGHKRGLKAPFAAKFGMLLG